jgi:hypothetical protein
VRTHLFAGRQANRVRDDRREDRKPLWRRDGRNTFIQAERRYAVNPDRIGEPKLFHEPGVPVACA